MTVLNPKEQFQHFHPDVRDEWRRLAGTPAVQIALTHSLGVMAFMTCTKDELRGANMLIGIALHLSEPEKTMEDRYPAQPLHDENAKPPVPV